MGQERNGAEMGCFVVVLGVGVWIGNSWVLSEDMGRMILGVLGGVGVDFVACELCGTTMPIRQNTLAL